MTRIGEGPLDAATDAFVAEAARQAVVQAADRLYVEPMRLAKGLGNGRLANLLIELQAARSWAYPCDRDRIDGLLEEVQREIGKEVPDRPSLHRRTLAGAGDSLAGEAPAGPGRPGAGRDSEEVERLCRYVSHEVRNRLNLVAISLARVAALTHDPRVRSALEPVRQAFHRLGDIADVLRKDVAPPGRTAQTEPEPSRLPVHTVVEEALSASRDLAATRGITLEVDDRSPDVDVDAARTELALVNLLTNALRYPDQHKDRHWVRVEVGPDDTDGNVLRIGVLDNGIGIPSQLRRSLLDPSPVDSSLESGMGLSIVRQTVERAGGRLWLESKEGVGTQVYFTLPAFSPDRVPASPPRQWPASLGSGAFPPAGSPPPAPGAGRPGR